MGQKWKAGRECVPDSTNYYGNHYSYPQAFLSSYFYRLFYIPYLQHTDFIDIICLYRNELGAYRNELGGAIVTNWGGYRNELGGLCIKYRNQLS